MTNPRLRIGLLMHSLNPRGGVVHTLELADALVARGHAVTLFAAARHGETLFRPTSARLSIAPLSGTPKGLVPMVGARIHAMHRHLQAWPALSAFDVLHSQDSITANALARLKSEGGIQGFVRTVHHLDQFSEPQLAAWQARGVRTASQVLCVSALWQGVLRQDWGIDAERVGNGVNLKRFHAHVSPQQADVDRAICARLHVQKQGPVWLAVGGVEGRKNTARLLQAFVKAREGRPDAQLVIAGGASLLEHDAEVQAFQAIRDAHGMAPGQPNASRLIVTGPLPEEALPALYRRATAVAMPSVKEGFGLVVIEALVCGTPAIASRIAPFTEHLEEGEVIWADPLDADDIARALLASLDEHVTQRIVDRAPAVCVRMSWPRSALRHEALYRRFLQHHTAARPTHHA